MFFRGHAHIADVLSDPLRCLPEYRTFRAAGNSKIEANGMGYRTDDKTDKTLG
jgi:hypothetical protein